MYVALSPGSLSAMSTHRHKAEQKTINELRLKCLRLTEKKTSDVLVLCKTCHTYQYVDLYAKKRSCYYCEIIRAREKNPEFGTDER